MSLVRIKIHQIDNLEYDLEDVIKLKNDKLSDEKILKKYIAKKHYKDYVKFITEINGSSFFDTVTWRRYYYTLEKDIKIIVI
jgi:hypothetical protein